MNTPYVFSIPYESKWGRKNVLLPAVAYLTITFIIEFLYFI